MTGFKIFLASSTELLLGCLWDDVETVRKTKDVFQVFGLSSWVLYGGTEIGGRVGRREGPRAE